MSKTNDTKNGENGVCVLTGGSPNKTNNNHNTNNTGEDHPNNRKSKITTLIII
jgi:hypothetical protein